MRTYIRKTNRVRVTQEQLERARDAIWNDGQSIRFVARKIGIPITTLARFMKKLKTQKHVFSIDFTHARQVFKKKQEAKLKDFLLHISAIGFDLTSHDIRRFAYNCAVTFKICYPDSWKINKIAGRDWLTMFRKRNPELSIGKSKRTSFNGAEFFNKTNIDQYFNKLISILLQYKIVASNIWNAGEISISAGSRPNKIEAREGIHNIDSTTSAKHSTSVTLITAISASGNTVPPMFIFPRKKYQNSFLSNAPPDSIGTGNASGCMTNEEFYIFMEHFIKHVRPSVEHPVLLLLANHSAYLAIKIVTLAKASGVIMLFFPRHCSHRLQPLDVSVFEPFRKHFSIVQDNWLCSNARKTMTIYSIPKIVAEALPLATTYFNIRDGFKKTGIFPYNREVFTNSNFAPPHVINRPADQTTPLMSILPNASQVNVQTVKKGNMSQNKDNDLEFSTSKDDPVPSTSKDDVPVSSTSEDDIEFSPQIITFSSKARRKQSQVKRKRKATTLTDTAKKDEDDPVPSTSKGDVPVSSTSEDDIEFFPQIITFSSKARRRKQSQVKRKRKATTLINMSEKDALAEEQSQQRKKTKVSAEEKEQVTKQILQEPQSEDKQYCYFVCDEAYFESLSKEGWIQCHSCLGWTPAKSTSSAIIAIFICSNCNSIIIRL